MCSPSSYLSCTRNLSTSSLMLSTVYTGWGPAILERVCSTDRDGGFFFSYRKSLWRQNLSLHYAHLGLVDTRGRDSGSCNLFVMLGEGAHHR